MTVDLSKITDLAERNKAAELYEAYIKADQAYESAMDADAFLVIPDDKKAEFSALEGEYNKRRIEVREWYDAASSAIRASIPGPPFDIKGAVAARDAAYQAYQDYPTSEVLTDGDGNPARCAISNVPLYENDEVMTDPETDEVVLRCMAGLPPRPKADEDHKESEAA